MPFPVSWPACLGVTDLKSASRPTLTARPFKTTLAWVTKAIPPAPSASDNNSWRVTRTAGVLGLSDTRSNQSEQLVFHWSGTSWHITQRNLYQIHVSAHIPPYYTGAGSVCRITRLMEDVSFIPGPHRQSDLMTSGGINSTQLTLSCIAERVQSRQHTLWWPLWSKAVRRLYLLYSNLHFVLKKKRKKKNGPPIA